MSVNQGRGTFKCGWKAAVRICGNLPGSRRFNYFPLSVVGGYRRFSVVKENCLMNILWRHEGESEMAINYFRAFIIFEIQISGYIYFEVFGFLVEVENVFPTSILPITFCTFLCGEYIYIYIYIYICVCMYVWIYEKWKTFIISVIISIMILIHIFNTYMSVIVLHRRITKLSIIFLL